MKRLFRLWRLGAQDLGYLFFALRQPNRPAWLVPATVALAVFAFEPFNFAVPLLGVVDDFVLLPFLLRALVKFAVGSAAKTNQRVVSVQ